MPIKLQVQQPPLMLLLTPLRWRKLPPLPQKPIRIPAFPVATERSNHWFNQLYKCKFFMVHKSELRGRFSYTFVSIFPDSIQFSTLLVTC